MLPILDAKCDNRAWDACRERAMCIRPEMPLSEHNLKNAILVPGKFAHSQLLIVFVFVFVFAQEIQRDLFLADITAFKVS
jgi:hypothetical protein